MKTIFITCFFNLVVRNLLETNFFNLLKQQEGIRIILLVPEKNKDFYQREFGAPNIIIEAIPFRPLSKINLLFHVLFWNLLSTYSKKIHKLVQRGKDHNYLRYIFNSLIAWTGSFGFVRNSVRFLDYRFTPGGGFDALFEKYRPDLIFATDLQDLRAQEFSDSYLVREARRRGIYSAGMGRSWDSMTTKGLLRTLPNIVVVQNTNIESWVINYHGVPKNRLRVVGIPHYDDYLVGQRSDRKEFMTRLGLDPARRYIFVTPPSDIWTGDKSFNKFLFNELAKLEEQTVIRLPLFGVLETGGFKPPAGMVFDVPQNVVKLEESMLRRSDDQHLANLIYHSAVVLTSPSSIILDSMIFDKPTVLIGFDGEKAKPFWDSLVRYYEYEHQREVIKNGKLSIAKSPEEMRDLLKSYLERPEQDGEYRKRVAEGACFKLDGKSGERLSNLLWNILTPTK
ncbi:MAG: hypothetical protein G01um10143_183 [Parcubacteria group bacterium Gr01-1014_3]|nr:MAG: hypothetical protein G01um10143_183 [Parcubacteria group bacterium Gr01-1014_3]